MTRFTISVHTSEQGEVGDIQAVLRAASTAIPADQESIARKRELVAELCRLLGRRIDGNKLIDRSTCGQKPFPSLSPRLKQTLELLMAGNSEKQIAHRLKLSPHIIHVHVKALHKEFGVSSRGELLARFIAASEGLSRTSQ